jgi:uncharacterized protein (TIGR03086 family)
VAELIELGRDREAAELAADDRTTDHRRDPGGTMDVFMQLDELGPVLGGVVSNITSDDLDEPTPCARFTVRDVLDHMVLGATAFAAAFRGSAPTEPDRSDVLAAFGPALGGLVEAIAGPGALDGTIVAPFGEVPREVFARFVVLDGLVHGWDLATATGQPYAPPDALVAEVTAFAQDVLAPMRDGETFAEAVTPPTDATPIERLAAFTGRQA